MVEKIRYEYKCADDYNPVYVTGVYGGPNASGDLIANFFLEHPYIAKEELFNLSQDGIIGDQVKDEEQSKTLPVSRSIQVGVIMNIETARVFRDWIDVYIKNSEALKVETK